MSFVERVLGQMGVAGEQVADVGEQVAIWAEKQEVPVAATEVGGQVEPVEPTANEVVGHLVERVLV